MRMAEGGGQHPRETPRVIIPVHQMLRPVVVARFVIHGHGVSAVTDFESSIQVAIWSRVRRKVCAMDMDQHLV